MKKKDKYSQKDAFNINFDFDDIDFESIGQTIKNSVNYAVSSFTKGYSKNLPAAKNPDICEQKPKEKSKSSLLKIGAIFVGMTLFAIGMDGIDSPGLGSNILGLTILAGAVAAPVFMWKLSNHYKRLAINYSRYRRELGNSTIISIRDLASAVSQTEEETIKDLLYFMKQNYFKQARIVENDSIFILDIPTFKLYKENLGKIPSYEKEKIEPAEDFDAQKASDILTNCGQILMDMEDRSRKIQSPSFRADLSPLFENIRDILNILEKYPEKAIALNKFNDFYMPTAAKLVESYQEFEQIDTNDPKILKSMVEIDGSIKTIAEAFDKIKVDLISDRAMDIKTDIDTINLVLKQEGLVEGDFKDHE
ncbi:5-bromo-4-chloroindolyl phosphate hydrolysis family protein [uncultured Anaerococcus sp.]|uniref:5-bromo-4-chloroindolyl phosphate hydrolysis family protein n=1 Tax=uncultured Anaerococcus sp. TaxID=293428 RepID=UPI002805BF0E|nr:5-bromo-4-chloroindolyl phosphate hydrolysis family protein [uncultured Anaerococcus sp.]